LAENLRGALSSIPGVVVYGPVLPAERIGVVSVNLQQYEPQEVAAALDAAYRIQVRSGLHCAARIHQSLGSAERGGTVRFSVGPFNTDEQVAVAATAVEELAAAAVHSL
jgi:cysteine desulfurase / selenocysteine lyase